MPVTEDAVATIEADEVELVRGLPAALVVVLKVRTSALLSGTAVALEPGRTGAWMLMMPKRIVCDISFSTPFSGTHDVCFMMYF